MKLFLKKVVIFFIGIFLLMFLLILLHVNFDNSYNKKSSVNSIFIWGDSQTYRGVDLKILSDKSGLNVFSAAKHGAGVYDFLVFANNVPENSIVFVSFSKPMFIRKKKNDYNSTSFDLNAIIILLQNNYSFEYCYRIFIKNIKQFNQIYESESFLYPVKDDVFMSESIERLNDFYSSVPNFISDKESIFTKGLSILKEKKCKINLIEFPYDQLLNEIEIKSPIKKVTDKIKTKILNNLSLKNEVVFLNNYKRVMYDLTHLNQNGAEQVSVFLAKKIKNKNSHFYTIQQTFK